MKANYSFRKLMNDIHLWLGLASGIVLFIVCLSGTIYTFHTEVEEWINKEKYFVTNSTATPLPLAVLVTNLETQFKSKVTRIEIPAEPTRMYKMVVKPASKKDKTQIAKNTQPENKATPKEKGKGKGKGKDNGKTYYVNPYTGAIAGQDGGAVSDFFLTMMKLHRWLLIEGDTGKMIVGVATIIFTLLCISGLIIWFPKKLKNWKQGLKLKLSGNWKRTNHDLHNTLGFYSLIFLLIMSLTGLCWSFEWYKDGLGKVLGVEIFAGRKEKPIPSQLQATIANTLLLDEVVNIAQQTFPNDGNLRISLPNDSLGNFGVNKYQTGFFAWSASDKMQIDQYTGKILKVDRFTDKPLNQKIAETIKSLHVGDLSGTSSKIIWFIACLIGTSLPITGTIIWINKLKKKKPKKQTSYQSKLIVEMA